VARALECRSKEAHVGAAEVREVVACYAETKWSCEGPTHCAPALERFKACGHAKGKTHEIKIDSKEPPPSP
jgi:hypothetical protein